MSSHLANPVDMHERVFRFDRHSQEDTESKTSWSTQHMLGEGEKFAIRGKLKSHASATMVMHCVNSAAVSKKTKPEPSAWHVVGPKETHILMPVHGSFQVQFQNPAKRFQSSEFYQQKTLEEFDCLMLHNNQKYRFLLAPLSSGRKSKQASATAEASPALLALAYSSPLETEEQLNQHAKQCRGVPLGVAFKTVKPTRNASLLSSLVPSKFTQILSPEDLFLLVGTPPLDRPGPTPAVRGPHDLLFVIAGTPSGDGPALHVHRLGDELFMCLRGRYTIEWGDQGEHSLVLEEGDLVCLPPGCNRRFENCSDTYGMLLPLVFGASDELDDIIFLPPVRKQLEDGLRAQYGFFFAKLLVWVACSLVGVSFRARQDIHFPVTLEERANAPTYTAPARANRKLAKQGLLGGAVLAVSLLIWRFSRS